MRERRKLLRDVRIQATRRTVIGYSSESHELGKSLLGTTLLKKRGKCVGKTLYKKVPQIRKETDL